MAKRTVINRDECVKISMDIPKMLRIRVRLSAARYDIGVGPEIVRALTEYYDHQDAAQNVESAS